MKKVGSLIEGNEHRAIYEISPGRYGVEGHNDLVDETGLQAWRDAGLFLTDDLLTDKPPVAADPSALQKHSLLMPLLLGAVGLIVFLLLFQQMYWQPPLDLKIDMAKSERLAGDQLSAIVKLPPGYSKVTSFASDAETLTFLDQKTSTAKIEKLIGAGLPFYTWQTRWFKELTEEEFTVGIDPTSGKINYFDKFLPEEARGERPTHKQALAEAGSFLKKNGYSLSDYRIVSDDKDRLKNRTDWYFEWEEKQFNADGVTHRISVGIYGGELGLFDDYLKVPDKWSRDFEKRMSVGNLMAMLTGIISIFLFVAMLGFFVFFMVKRQKLIWRYALIVAVITALFSILMTVSTWSDLAYNYSTEISYTVYLAGAIATLVAGIALLFGSQLISIVTANAAAERYLGAGKSLIVLNLKSDQRFYKGLSRSFLAGYGLAGFMLGFVSVFYFVAGMVVNAWSPAAPSYDTILSMKWAWLAPVSVGFMAALLEEILFRWFSISIAKRFLRLTPLALLLPAVLWAFGHSDYTVFPVYLRGIELTVVGVVIGIFFLNYGIEATIIAHFLFNTFLGALDFLNIGASAYQNQGVGLLALLGLIFLLAFLSFVRITVNSRRLSLPDTAL